MAENLNGLPDVDLGPVLKDLKENQDKGEEARAEGKENVDLAQFKTPEALLEGYKNIQAYSTKVSQENKLIESEREELKQRIADLEETMRLAPQAAPVNQQGQQFEDIYYENPRAAIGMIVNEAVGTQRIADVLEAEAEKGTAEEFQERYAYAQQMAAQNPHLSKTPAGVRKLFKDGDKLRKERMKAGASSALEQIFGEPLSEEEISNLRTMVKGKKETKTNKNNNAYMPDISTTTRTGADTDQGPNTQAKIAEAVENADVDGVLQGLFASVLAE